MPVPLQGGLTEPTMVPVFGKLNGFAVTLLLLTEVHPATVCVAVKVPDVTVRGLPDPASLHVKVPVTPDAVMVELPQLSIMLNTGAEGMGVGFAVTLLLLTEVHPATVCVAVNVPEVTVRGLPDPASLQVKVPVTPDAVMVEFPQLFTTLNIGAEGMGVGFAVTLLLLTEVHPATVCVAVKVPDVTVRGLPVPASLQVKVPVTPDALMVELPQLLTTLNTGAEGIGVGFAVTLLLFTEVHPATVCVAVNVPEVTVRGLPVPASLQVKVPVTPDAVMVEFPQLLITLNTGADGIEMGLATINAVSDPQPATV
jgi:hypothetical protein